MKVNCKRKETIIVVILLLVRVRVRVHILQQSHWTVSVVSSLQSSAKIVTFLFCEMFFRPGIARDLYLNTLDI